MNYFHVTTLRICYHKLSTSTESSVSRLLLSLLAFAPTRAQQGVLLCLYVTYRLLCLHTLGGDLSNEFTLNVEVFLESEQFIIPLPLERVHTPTPVQLSGILIVK